MRTSERFLVVLDELFRSFRAAFTSRAEDENWFAGGMLLDEFEQFGIESFRECEIVIALVVTVDDPAYGRS